MQNLNATNNSDYQLLDSASGKKVEIIAGLKVERPCPQAIWGKRLKPDAWRDYHGNCIRRKDGGGEWKFHKPLPDKIYYHWQDEQKEKFKFLLKFTSFGHCGIFFEQESIWKMIQKNLGLIGGSPKFLNLFGYTGAASIIAAKAGAEVTHVDSAKGVLNWGRENATLNNVENRIRWFQEDAFKFVENTQKKNIVYDAILADPPSWGHGAKKEVWNFEEDIAKFVETLSKIMNPKKSFLILTSHTHGVQTNAIANLVGENLSQHKIQSGELGVEHAKDSRILPAGIYTLASRF